jgi:hypothetical protein
VTVDTNVLGETTIERLTRSVSGLEVEFAPTTVSGREWPERASRLRKMVRESAVWGESQWGQAVWRGPVYEAVVLGESFVGECVVVGEESASLVEEILEIIGNGSFPKPGDRDELTLGQRHQLRDAMILEAHVREGRDVLVSEDVTAYVRHGRRKRLEELCKTQIMTTDEFCDYAKALPRS